MAKVCKIALDASHSPGRYGGMPGKTMTTAAAARYLGLSRRTLYNMMQDGRFSVAPVPHAKPRRWNVEDLDAWRRGL